MIDASVEARFGAELSELKAELAAAQEELKKITDAALQAAVEAARAGLNQAVIDLESAREKFANALETTAQLQTAAFDTLHRSESTRPLGVMLKQHSTQMAAVAAARHACEMYVVAANNGRKQVGNIANTYGMVGSWLDEAAAYNPVYDRSNAYAQNLDRFWKSPRNYRLTEDHHRIRGALPTLSG